MADAVPYVRFIDLKNGKEPDALLGFALPFLPDMLTSRWLSSPNPHLRLQEALDLQIALIGSLWSSGVAAWDLRFLGTDELPGVAIGLLCRVRRPIDVPARGFQGYCLEQARRISQLFADYGYELLPLIDERSLMRYLTPFQLKALAEIRRCEKLHSFVDAYTEFDVYVPYPWEWRVQNRLRLFEALLYRQSNCLISVSLEPIRLSEQEQHHLNHATSQRLRAMLFAAGPIGETAYTVYEGYKLSLRQPYLLRISLAAAQPRTVEHIGRVFLDELKTQYPGTGPVLEYPQNPHEWQQACHNLFGVVCKPWGHTIGMDLPGTARLRHLIDAKMGSMAFRLPVASNSDVPGIPVRSLTPSLSGSSGGGTRGRGSSSATPPNAQPPYPPTQPSPGSKQTPPLSATPAMQTAQFSGSGVPPINVRQPEDLLGKTFGNCQIEALLGKGGFGAVYRAKQLHLNRVVAVKVMLSTISNSDPQKRRKMEIRFQREAEAVARLDHPNVLILYEYQGEPLPYLVMPYVAGGSLADELEASGKHPLPLSGVAAILAQVAAALDHAHRQQLVHRDIKPHNLLRHADGRVLLADFGIVQFEESELTALTTDKKASPYTPAYASPEQHQWLKVDHRSDIYSLGIVIYELLCGERPFKTVYEHAMSAPPPLQRFGVQVPHAVETVINRALAKQPEQRYSSAGEMASDFQKAMLVVH